MDVLYMLDKLKAKARNDENLRRGFLDTRNADAPVEAFCRICRELGYPLYEMDLISAGEDFYAAMRRSTNGGGENSPKLAGEDDFYEIFLTEISM